MDQQGHPLEILHWAVLPQDEYHALTRPHPSHAHHIFHEDWRRVFNNPETVLNEEMLKPELQDVETFIVGIETTQAAHKLAAENYFKDGSIDLACPPLKALLHIMAYGEYEGKGLESEEVRSLFTRESMLKSDWYQKRLESQQTQHIKTWTAHVEYLNHFMTKSSHTGVAQRLQVESRLTAAKAELERISASDYQQQLVGTIGREPIQ